MFASKDIFLKSSGGAYQISRSVRLRASATAYLNRTNSSSVTNNKIFTYSLWVKRGSFGVTSSLLAGDNSTAIHYFGYGNSSIAADTLEFYDGQTAAWKIQTNAVYRDPSAYYHVILSVDTTQATAANRVRIYVNGVECSYATATYPAQNTVPNINVASMPLYIGRRSNVSQWYLDGYLTEINFIDGQALTPSSFGETNAITGVWQPKAYSGTYGTNGFELNFSDNSTAAALGTDFSGNSNTWTVNNISVTAGVTYDSMLDVPTLYADGGNGRGNYAVLNPLDLGGGQTTTNGNLTVNYTSGSWTYGRAGFWVSSNKWYWEVTITAMTNGGLAFGICNQSALKTGSGNNDANFWFYNAVSGVLNSNTTNPTSVASSTTNDIISFAFDVGGATLAVYKNNSLLYTFTGITGSLFTAITGQSTSIGGSCAFNFGQRPFAYTPPTGFVALNTQNLPTPTISNGASYMAATTYTGTGSALTIANTVGSASFQPDLVWVKGRSGATDHAWYDAVRGVQKQIESNSTGAETTETTGLTAFGSTGFTIGALAQMNTSAATYVGWQWNAGGSTVTNTSGTISAQVRANPTAGFSVVTYTGTGSAATIGHGLGVAPRMIIIFERSPGGDDHIVYHASLTSNQYSIRLNTTAAQAGASGAYWNSTSPTSSVFSVGTSGESNQSTATYVAYCFAAVDGYSAFGSYTGNGSADGPFVFTGFRPRFILIKASSRVADWVVVDTSRSTYNVATAALYPNSSVVEDTGITIDILSNGFKPRAVLTNCNASGETYIYMAFAEVPFRSALAR